MKVFIVMVRNTENGNNFLYPQAFSTESDAKECYDAELKLDNDPQFFETVMIRPKKEIQQKIYLHPVSDKSLKGKFADYEITLHAGEGDIYGDVEFVNGIKRKDAALRRMRELIKENPKRPITLFKWYKFGDDDMAWEKEEAAFYEPNEKNSSITIY